MRTWAKVLRIGGKLWLGFLAVQLVFAIAGAFYFEPTIGAALRVIAAGLNPWHFGNFILFVVLLAPAGIAFHYADKLDAKAWCRDVAKQAA